MRLTAISVPVHYFAQPVVTLIGLGIAIDYGLFVVSRFREEIAEGHDTETAVRRTVVTAGRTIAFSSVLISASVGGLLGSDCWWAPRWMKRLAETYRARRVRCDPEHDELGRIVGVRVSVHP